MSFVNEALLADRVLRAVCEALAIEVAMYYIVILERRNAEIKRRTDVVGVLPIEPAIVVGLSSYATGRNMISKLLKGASGDYRRSSLQANKQRNPKI
jgi:hypothetical protein